MLLVSDDLLINLIKGSTNSNDFRTVYTVIAEEKDKTVLRVVFSHSSHDLVDIVVKYPLGSHGEKVL